MRIGIAPRLQPFVAFRDATGDAVQRRTFRALNLDPNAKKHWPVSGDILELTVILG